MFARQRPRDVLTNRNETPDTDQTTARICKFILRLLPYDVAMVNE